MGTLGLETVFISNIVDGVGLTIISNEGERALDDDGFFISTNVLQLTLSFSFNTITGSISILEGFGANFRFGFQDDGIFRTGSSQSNGEESSEDNDEFHFVKLLFY